MVMGLNGTVNYCEGCADVYLCMCVVHSADVYIRMYVCTYICPYLIVATLCVPVCDGAFTSLQVLCMLVNESTTHTHSQG